MEKRLSVILPACNEESMIAKAADAVTGVLNNAEIPYELIFVDDGSRDSTWQRICEQSQKDPGVTGLMLSRNFGKESAIFAGLYNAKGDCCAVMDCDLQHPPEKLVEMYRLWQDGYEVIEGVKIDRGEESLLHGGAARCFYQILSRSAQLDMNRASDFKLLDRKAVNAMLSMREKNAFFRALTSWVGFKTAQVEFKVQPRTAGKTKWSTWRLMKYALRNISSFTTAPMQIITALGVVMLTASLLLGGIALYQKIAGIALGGFTTVIILQLFIGSITMISLGIIGYYIARMYEEVKGRPRFIVSECCGSEKASVQKIG